ncbi:MULTISPECIES: hypothetical protein [Bacillus]|uniref:hypothetical protein n=1 Tax=Bacillus TaxID=1386 RepID=UPI00031C8CC0|nr:MULTISPECIES: hypothetical protein [Bacillus]
MVLLGTVLPILILVGVAFLLRYLRQSKSNVFVPIMNWLFSGYIIILLIAILIAGFLPNEKQPLNKKEFVVKAEKEVNDFQDAIYRGNLDKIDSKLLRTSQAFDFQGESLNIREINDGYLEVPIVIEENSADFGHIEAMIYTSKTYYMDQDVTEQIPIFQMDFQKDTLIISKSNQTRLNFNKLSHEFPFRQFSGEKMFNNDENFIGLTVLFLRVPKGVKIENQDNLNIEYVRK